MAKWLVFSSPAVMDLNGLLVFGLSAKREEGPKKVGMFGSGLKYALAIVARLGGDVVLEIGGIEYGLVKTDIGSRQQTFVQLVLRQKDVDGDFATTRDIPLPFTTDLGKTWESWFALRELYSNTLDEGGTIEVFDSIFEEAAFPDGTNIFVSCDELMEAWEEKDKYFLNGPPLKTEGEVEFHLALPGQEAPVFYHGFNLEQSCGLREEGQFAINLTGQLKLTEDRRLAQPEQVPDMIRRGLAGSDSGMFLQLFLASSAGREKYLDLDWSWIEPGEVFANTVVMMKMAGTLQNDSAWELVKKKAPVKAQVWLEAERPKTVKEANEREPEVRELDAAKAGWYSILHTMEMGIGELEDQVKYWRELALGLLAEKEEVVSVTPLRVMTAEEFWKEAGEEDGGLC